MTLLHLVSILLDYELPRYPIIAIDGSDDIRSFGKMLDVIHAGGGKTKWKMAEDVFSWWMEEETIKGQMSLFDITEWKNVNET